MQLPVKAHYATVAMLALAQKYVSREPLPAKCIAREQHIPNQFLLQIMQQLRSAGLVTSTRGAQGGFALQRSPELIRVSEIVDAVCSPQSNAWCDASGPLSAVALEVWDDLQQQQRSLLEGLSLGDLLQRSNRSAPMFYI